MLTALDGSKDFKVFILADTSYGSCCVDEVSRTFGGKSNFPNKGEVNVSTKFC